MSQLLYHDGYNDGYDAGYEKGFAKGLRERAEEVERLKRDIEMWRKVCDDYTDARRKAIYEAITAVNPPRYILHPGYVPGKADTYVPAPILARLYGVEYKKCVVIPPGEVHYPKGFTPLPNDVHLYPRADGRYVLPIPRTR